MAMAQAAQTTVATVELPSLWQYKEPAQVFDWNQNHVAQLLWHSDESGGIEVVAKVFLSPWDKEVMRVLPNIMLWYSICPL